MNYNFYSFKSLLFTIVFLLSFGAKAQMISSSNGSGSIILLRSDGKLFGWGENSYSVVANTGLNIIISPVEVSSATWKTVSVGTIHTLAIKEDGTLWAWGRNNNGQLGDNSTTDRSTPVQIGTDTDWKMVSASASGHSAAIKNNGSLYMWGWGSGYALGFGGDSNVLVPTRLGTDTWKDVSCGQFFTLAIKSNGTLWGWGFNNSNGRVNGTNVYTIEFPTQIGSFNDWAMVSAGALSHSAGSRTNAGLYTWGNNSNGQLGTGAGTGLSPVTKVGTDQNWKTVSVGYWYTIALKTDGTIWAWGQSANGKLGLGTPLTDMPTPQKVGTGTDWKMVLAGADHSVALKNDGTVWTTGNDSRGQMGNGTSSMANISTFTQVGGVLPLTLIDFTASLKPNFVALAWRTAQESNTADFDVERRTDHSDWQKIATVNAAGFSKEVRKYTYNDYDISRSTYYYRLKMNDLDGSFAYSKMASSHFMEEQEVLAIYPNPATDKITVKGNISSYTIHNLEGKKVQEGEPGAGNQIRLEALASGLYLISLEVPGGVTRIKLQKN